MGPEAKVERALRRAAEDAGFLCLKFVSPANAGVPDRVLIGNSRVWFVELKAPGAKPRLLQVVQFKRLLDAGAFVFVIDSEAAARALVSELKALPPPPVDHVTTPLFDPSSQLKG